MTLNGRVNSRLDQDFTAYQVRFVEQDDGTYTPTYTDDYNIKAKSRNYWISMNVAF